MKRGSEAGMDLRKTRIKAQIALIRDQLQELERLINLEPEPVTVIKPEQRPDYPLLMSVTKVTKVLGAIGRGKVYELIRD